jgi:hypothetical protein
MHMTMSPAGTDRRNPIDRRRHALTAVWHGSRFPRRRGGRRAADRIYPIVDWHSPRVLAPVIGILGLCALDAVLTLILMSHGAEEINPFLAPLLPDRLGWFAAVKFTLTGIGVCALVVCSRMKLFRAVRGEWLLYTILLCYLALFGYQLRLLELVHR